MTEPMLETVDGHGVKIQLVQWGHKGKAILCIHGITANCRCWDVMASPLNPDHRVMAMDLRGRGRSDRPDTGYSISHHCRDILAVLDHLEIEKAVIMGHSLGAFIATAFGAKHSERVDRIILVDGGGKLSEIQMMKVFAGIKSSLDRLGRVFPSFEAYLDLMKTAPFYKAWTPALETYYRYETEEVDGGVGCNVRPEHIQEERENLGKVDISKSYEKISCPVLILRATDGMVGEDDLLLPQNVVETMVHKIPNARYVDIPGTNHYSIIFDQNEMRDRTIREFLKK